MFNFNENSQNLPKLPVPKLKETLRKYIKSLKPIVTNEELINTTKLVENFECSDTATKLQKYLLQRAAEKLNWLNEWYVSKRYLDNRLPIALFGNPGQMFPLGNFKSEDDRLVYASKLILGVISYNMLIKSKTIPIEKSGIAELDMSQYDMIFGACRIPSFPSDKQQFYPKSEHIIIVYKNQFYKLQLFYNSELLSETQLFKSLKTIVNQPAIKKIPVGILTTEQRDVWSTVYQELIKENCMQINEIESSLFLVCIDDPVREEDSKNTLTMAGEQIIHGGGSKANSGNRWFDKTVQFIIGHNGIAGVVFEHSICDGTPIASMVDYVDEFIQNNNEKSIAGSNNTADPLKLSFHITHSMLAHVEAAENNFNRSVQNSDLEWFKFNHYGKAFIKSVQLSPDSYVQIAFQLAFYKLRNKPAIAYEAVSLRKFAKGRLESLRCFSEESVSFCKIALELSKTVSEKFEALKLAVNTHKKACVEAGNGFGTERHFMGLQCAAKEIGIDPPLLFLEESFTKSTIGRFATSHVATKCDALMGFGTIPTDIGAVCYNLRDYDINFSIYSFKSNTGTNTKLLKDSLITSLYEMKNILLENIED